MKKALVVLFFILLEQIIKKDGNTVNTIESAFEKIIKKFGFDKLPYFETNANKLKNSDNISTDTEIDDHNMVIPTGFSLLQVF